MRYSEDSSDRFAVILHVVVVVVFVLIVLAAAGQWQARMAELRSSLESSPVFTSY